MIIKNLVVGPLEENCFIIGDALTKASMVVDPGDEPERIMQAVSESRLDVKYIVCTHAHFDHVGAVAFIKKRTGAEIVIHEDELELYRGARDQAVFFGYELEPLPEPDIMVKDGSKIKIGNLSFSVLHTPGHSPGSMSIFGEGIILTGDTLFAGSVGRTDFYGGDMNKLKKSFGQIMALPPETRVLAGHGPESTIGEESTQNCFLDLFT